MTDIALEVFELQSILDEVIAWVQKNKLGMSKEDAKRIFHRYRTVKESPAGEPSEAPSESGPEVTPPPASQALERQAKQISQILDYMEQNTERLGKIEDDIDYIKEKVDSILKRL